MYVKLTFLLISIAILATSCNTDSSDDICLSGGAELSFDVSDLTRGSVTTSINQFFVYGDFKRPSSELSIPFILFDKTKVVYKNNKWSYDGTQYWIPRYEHSFVAVAPVEIFETGDSPRYLDSKLSFEYTLPAPGGILSNNSDVADILVATHRRYYENDESIPAADNSITFKFSHLLSLINIAPAFYDKSMNSDDYALIHKLEFSGITTKAQFNILPAPRLSNSKTDDVIIDVNRQEEGNITIEFSSPVKIENNANNIKLFADDDAIIMLPQNFEFTDSDAKITVSYTIKGDDLMKQGSLNLNNLKWESGKNYCYKFTIERVGVEFDKCEITPWNVIKGEDITVD